MFWLILYFYYYLFLYLPLYLPLLFQNLLRSILFLFILCLVYASIYIHIYTHIHTRLRFHTRDRVHLISFLCHLLPAVACFLTLIIFAGFFLIVGLLWGFLARFLCSVLIIILF